MILEIKLEDPEYCDGCPCYEEEYGTCQHYGKEIIYNYDKFPKLPALIRLQRCIKEDLLRKEEENGRHKSTRRKIN